MTPQRLTEYHLELLLYFNNCTNKHYALSASKQKSVNELVSLKLMRIDEDDGGWIYLTDEGKAVHEAVLNSFISTTVLINR